jgi:DNA polymerase elongation subunit (family B)
MVGYRNAVYNSRERVVDIYTWSEDGKRIVTSIPFFPYFYYEDNSGEETSIFDTSIKRKSFNTNYDKVMYLKERNLKRIFDNYNPVQQALIDTYAEHNDSDNFSKYPLKVYFLDIEAVGNQGFSKPENPEDPINVITVYDSLSKKYHVWGLKPYEPKQKDVKYYYCTSEVKLLQNFIDFIKDNPPDILSGWSSDRYDIPYIINRIVKILGSEEADALSPYKRRYVKMIMVKFGKQEVVHRIDGISCIDYMDIYKKFCPLNRESYKLDYIGQVELDEAKVDYGNQSLYEFMINEWETFVDYNIQDVRLLAKLEEKLRYIELLRMLSYSGCTTFESALGTVSVVTGAAGIGARKIGKRLCTFVVDDENLRDFEGGYVAQPLAGHHKSIVSFDANSLYPNTMITLNTSPETKIGKVISYDKDLISIRNVDGIIVDFTIDDFKKYIKKEKISISKAKVLFSQKKKGILADLVDNFYKKRVEIRKEIKDLKIKVKELKGVEKKETKELINRLDTKQMAQKTLINSAYGATANKYCPIGDVDIAESITLTGQSLIKQSRQIFINFVKEKFGNKFTDDQIETKIIANDTDSEYLSFDGLVDKFSENGIITSQAYKLADEFQLYLNNNINNWAKTNLNTIDSRFEFKRETMCDAGIFLEKKRYVLHVLDKEGIPCDDWKYTGIEVVSTKMPKSIKPYVKKIIENIVLTKSESLTNKVFLDAYHDFFNKTVEDISVVVGIKNLEKYEQTCNGFSTSKGMPCHVKAAYYYNLLLDELGLDKKYEKIISGDKIKYFYVETPNVYGIDAIAYKTRYPNEFDEFLKPDMEEMFEKDMYKCVERFYKVMKWIPRKPTEQLMCTLDDLFS